LRCDDSSDSTTRDCDQRLILPAGHGTHRYVGGLERLRRRPAHSLSPTAGITSGSAKISSRIPSLGKQERAFASHLAKRARSCKGIGGRREDRRFVEAALEEALDESSAVHDVAAVDRARQNPHLERVS